MNNSLLYEACVCPPRAYRHCVEVNPIQRQSVGHVQEPPVAVARCESSVLLVGLNHFSYEFWGLQPLKGRGVGCVGCVCGGHAAQGEMMT